MVYSIPHIFPYRCQGYKRDLDGKLSKYLHSHEYTEELVQKLPVKTLWKDFCIIQDVVVCSFFWEVFYGSNQWPWIAIYKQLWMCRYPWTHCTWSATSNHHRHIQGSFGGMDSRIHQCNIKTRSKDQKSSRWYWPKASSIYSKISATLICKQNCYCTIVLWSRSLLWATCTGGTKWPLSPANLAQNSPGNYHLVPSGFYQVVLNSKSTESTEKKMHTARIESTASVEHIYNN